MYYFITWIFFTACWSNGLLNCVPFTYQKIFLGCRYTLSHIYEFGPLCGCKISYLDCWNTMLTVKVYCFPYCFSNNLKLYIICTKLACNIYISEFYSKLISYMLWAISAHYWFVLKWVNYAVREGKFGSWNWTERDTLPFLVNRWWPSAPPPGLWTLRCVRFSCVPARAVLRRPPRPLAPSIVDPV